jgi:hypothetical protein
MAKHNVERAKPSITTKMTRNLEECLEELQGP